MNVKLNLINLLQMFGFASVSETRLVRHKDSRYDVRHLLKKGWLEAYQGYQKRDIFGKTRFVIAFIGEKGTTARLHKIYRVMGQKEASEAPVPEGCPFTEWQEEAKRFYEFEHVTGFEEIEGRVIIDWGKGALSWHQNLETNNKEVISIRPKGEVRPPFKDYLEFVLNYDELVELVKNVEANQEWRARLSAVAGIYMVLATTTGEQYIGSAHGESGIWGRWENYATNGHGGNEYLRKLIEEDRRYPAAFHYSILQILPKTLTHKEVLEWERKYKDKLGTRATGLNLN